MSDKPNWRWLDDLRRDELDGVDKALADALDDWLFRMHGIQSGGHYVGVFRDRLDEYGVFVAAASPSVGSVPENPKEATTE